MLKVLSHLFRARFKITKLIISITLFTLHGCQSTQLSLRQGQDTQFNFPYPCDSTEVTIQHGHKVPFYRLTDGSLLSLPQDQAHRFKVQNRSENGNCSLDLTISNLMRSDAGTYIAFVYKDGQLIVDLTTMGLQIEYPPGKASCVEEEDKGGGWVAMECTADVGSISGKIECYQNGEKMPSLTDPVETHATLTEIILIRKSQPAFCCSSILHEDKIRCECNDTALNLADDSSKDPCSTTSAITTMPFVYNVTQNNQMADHYSTMTTSTSMMMKDDNCKEVIIHSIILPVEVILLLSVCLFVHYKMKTTKRTKHNGSGPLKSSELLLKMTNGSIKENGIVM